MIDEAATDREREGRKQAMREGAAADRERHVTERAEQIARAFHSTTEARKPEGEPRVAWDDWPPFNRAVLVSIFRDLIDRGVLK